MCSMPECYETPQTRRVKTNIKGTVAVELTICPKCDTRRCTCGIYVLDPFTKTCPSRHIL